MDIEYWFTKKSKQFLKNIDTLYYSVYFEQDMTSTSTDHSVYKLRCFLDELRNIREEKELSFGDYKCLYVPGRFSVYNFRFSCPDFFDFFVAPSVNTQDTPGAILQLRSRVLWEDRVYSAVDASLDFVRAFCAKFGLRIREVSENRCDYACHTNYLKDPEKFFDRDNFVKMWVGRVGRTSEHTKVYMNHITVYDDDSTETDYVAIGKRGGNCFIRIYLKSKEVVQEGYKGFFLKIWHESGLINRYDLFCLEEAYKEKSWAYVDIARLRWAYDNDDTLTDEVKEYIKSLIDDDKADINQIHLAAKTYTQPVTKIFNIEFQVMRSMSKTFQLIPRDNEGVTKRLYDYLDNYSLIYDYLTRESFRLCRTDQNDTNKSRREDNEFWKRLRSAKSMEFRKKHKQLKLIRKYSSNINLEIRKKRAINALSCFGFAMNNDPENSIMDDAATLLSILNDNDLDYIDRRKKKLAASNREVIPDEQKRFRSVMFLYDPDNDTFY